MPSKKSKLPTFVFDERSLITEMIEHEFVEVTVHDPETNEEKTIKIPIIRKEIKL